MMGDHAERTLVLAPLGRDARIASRILEEAGLKTTICGDLRDLVGELEAGAGVGLIVEEVLHGHNHAPLARWLEDQPAWSDFPILVLAQRGAGLERNPAASRLSQTLGNVTFLERPFHPTTLVSVVRTALRGRRRQYEARQRMEDVRTAKDHFRTLADNMPALCWMARPDGHIFWYNRRWYEYTGQKLGEPEGWGWASVHDPEMLPQVSERWNHSLASGEPFDMTFPLKGEDGCFRPFLTRVTPLRDESGQIVRWFGTNIDVSRQLQDQDHLRLMVNELNHRVKNTLATIQSIVAQTLRRENTEPRIREVLTSRIVALSRAHDVLTDEQWAGADLREIAGQAASPYREAGGAERFLLSGPPVRMPPKTAIAVALAFHELATNAAKYGALSIDGGRVELTWTVDGTGDDRVLRVLWRETGGPRVKPLTHAGFGTRLIERGLAADLRGQVVLAYPPEGVVCTIEARLSEEDNAPSVFAPTAAIAPTPAAVVAAKGSRRRLKSRV